MARRSDFTEDEWQALQHGVTGSALLLAAAEGGAVSAIKEARAFAQQLDRSRRTSGSALVHDLATATRTEVGLSRSGAEVERETLDALRAAVATLHAKAPDELEAYRTLVREVAATVSGAAGRPGLVERAALRLSGAADSEASEDAVLARIEAAMGEPGFG